MPLPTQTEVEIPLLRVIESLGGEAMPRDVYGPVAKYFPQLTEEDLAARMDSGPRKWWNHVQWARQRLVEKQEIDGSVRGVWRITPLGRTRLGSVVPDNRVDKRPNNTSPSSLPASIVSESPAALIETAHRELRRALSAELLQVVMGCSPEFFERLVIDLLVKMGYGGTRSEGGERSVSPVTAVLTGSSRKTVSASASSTCRQNAGTRQTP